MSGGNFVLVQFFFNYSPEKKSRPDICETVEQEQQQNATREIKTEVAENKGVWALTSSSVFFFLPLNKGIPVDKVI